MGRIYGINFEGAGDGVGLDPEKIKATLPLFERKLMVGLVMFTDIEPKEYLPICEAIKSAGCEIFLRVVDSEAMVDFGVDGYRKRYETTLEVLGPFVDIVECANEVSGSRGDDKWPGPRASMKMVAALEVAKTFGIPRAITLYFNNDDYSYVWEWVEAHQFEFDAEYIFMSDYVLAGRQGRPCHQEEIIRTLNQKFPNSYIGFGEYGLEKASGQKAKLSPDTIKILESFEKRIPINEKDVVGNFYWDAYKDMILNPDKSLIDSFKRYWDGAVVHPITPMEF